MRLASLAIVLSVGSLLAVGNSPLTASVRYDTLSEPSAKYQPALSDGSMANGPWGGTISALAIEPGNPQTLYASSEGFGIAKTKDGGRRWTAATEGIDHAHIRALAIDPAKQQTVYAGGEGFLRGYIYKSVDGGKRWHPTGFRGREVHALSIDPREPETLFAAALRGVHKSGDGGVTWQRVLDRDANALVLDPAEGALYAGTDSGVFKSIDGGISWIRSVEFLTRDKRYVARVTALAAGRQPGIVYAGTDEGDFYKSSDGGVSWIAADGGLPSRGAIAALAVDAGSRTVYAAVSWYVSWAAPIPQRNAQAPQGVYVSMDAGANWAPAGVGIFDTDVLALAVDPLTPGLVYAGTRRHGVFTSANAGTNWRAASVGLAISVSALAIDPRQPRTLYAGSATFPAADGGGSFAGPGVFKSTDGGVSWRAMSGGLPSGGREIGALAVDGGRPLTVYAGLSSGAPGAYANRGGEGEWRPRGLQKVYVSALALDPKAPRTIYAAGDGRLYKSLDGGTHWRALTLRGGGLAVAVDPHRPQIVYAGGYRRGVFKSTDGGNHWRITSRGLPPRSDGYAIAVDPRVPQAVYLATNHGLFKSSDGGASWYSVFDIERQYVSALAIDPKRPQTVYAGTSGFVDGRFVGGVYRSTDGGASWRRNGLARGRIHVLRIDQAGARLYAGTDYGVLVLRLFRGGGRWDKLR